MHLCVHITFLVINGFWVTACFLKSTVPFSVYSHILATQCLEQSQYFAEFFIYAVLTYRFYYSFKCINYYGCYFSFKSHSSHARTSYFFTFFVFHPMIYIPIYDQTSTPPLSRKVPILVYRIWAGVIQQVHTDSRKLVAKITKVRWMCSWSFEKLKLHPSYNNFQYFYDPNEVFSEIKLTWFTRANGKIR